MPEAGRGRGRGKAESGCSFSRSGVGGREQPPCEGPVSCSGDAGPAPLLRARIARAAGRRGAVGRVCGGVSPAGGWPKVARPKKARPPRINRGTGDQRAGGQATCEPASRNTVCSGPAERLRGSGCEREEDLEVEKFRGSIPANRHDDRISDKIFESVKPPTLRVGGSCGGIRGTSRGGFTAAQRAGEHCRGRSRRAGVKAPRPYDQ